MTDLAQFRILYVGRKAQFADYLHGLFEQQNQIVDNRQQARRTTSQRLPRTTVSEWPTVEFERVANQKAALQLLRTRPPTAIIIELEQKPASRLQFCEKIRYRLPTVAILALMPKELVKESSKAFAFDGLIQLPFEDDIILNLIHTLGLQRTEHELQHGPIRLNMAARTVITPSGQYTMTPKQCALLKLFMGEHGQVVERSKIMERVWETSYLDDTRTLDVHIRWLRERIEQDPSNPVYLKTIRGVGYRFSVNGDES